MFIFVFPKEKIRVLKDNRDEENKKKEYWNKTWGRQQLKKYNCKRFYAVGIYTYRNENVVSSSPKG